MKQAPSDSFELSSLLLPDFCLCSVDRAVYPIRHAPTEQRQKSGKSKSKNKNTIFIFIMIFIFIFITHHYHYHHHPAHRLCAVQER